MMRSHLRQLNSVIAGSCLLLVLSLLWGCGGNTPTATATATNTNSVATAATAASPYPGLPTKAQPKLQTIKLWLGSDEMITEIAADRMAMATGMMFRTNMAENEGMLFVFPFPQQASFWMMNTKIPLSAAYIDPEGTILEIHKLEPENTNSVQAATDRIQFVLETPQGWFERHNVRTGAVIRTERGSLPEVFLNRRPAQ